MAPWRRLAVVFAASTWFDMAAWGQMQAFTPLYLRVEFGLSPEEVSRWTGILTSVMLLPALPLGPIWGALADRWGRKPIILRGIALSVVGYLLTAWAPTVEVLLLARVVFGFGFGIMVGILAAQADVTPGEHVASAISLIQMMNPLGLALGPLVGGVLIGLVGPRGLWVLTALNSVISFTLILVLFREPKRTDRTSLGRKLTASIGTVARSRQLLGVFATIFLMAVGAALLDPFVPVFLDQLYRGDDAAAFVGVGVAGFWLVTGLLTPVLGRFADRLGRERVFGWSLMAIAGAVLLMAWLPPLTGEPAWVLAALNVLRGLPQSATVGLALTLIILYVSAEQRASVLSLTPFPRHLANFTAPLLGALLAPLGPAVLFSAAALAFLAAWAIIRFTPRPAADPAPADQPA